MSFEKLPIVMRASIFDYLSYKELQNVELVCTSFRKGIEKCFQWRCKRDFPNAEKIEGVSWKITYKNTRIPELFEKAHYKKKLVCTGTIPLLETKSRYMDMQEIDGDIFVTVKEIMGTPVNRLAKLNFEKNVIIFNELYSGWFLENKKFLNYDNVHSCLTILDFKTGEESFNIPTKFLAPSKDVQFKVHCFDKNLFLQRKKLHKMRRYTIESKKNVGKMVCISKILLKEAKINYSKCKNLNVLNANRCSFKKNTFFFVSEPDSYQSISICDVQNGIFEEFRDENNAPICMPKLIVQHKLGYCVKDFEGTFIKVIDLESKKNLIHMKVNRSDAIYGITTFSVIGNLIITGSKDGKLYLWKKNEKQSFCTLSMNLKHDCWITKVHFNEKMIVAQCPKALKIWKIEESQKAESPC